MLVSEVFTRVKRQFGDEVGAQILDTDAVRWCNDAQQEIAIQNKLLQTTSTVSSVINQQDYPLPTDLLALRGVNYDKMRLKYVTLDDVDKIVDDRTDLKGIPGYYWVFASTLSLWPTPDAVKSIVIMYTKYPVALNVVGDALTIPAQYNNRVIEYCIAQAAELDDDLEHYQLKMSQFQNGIDAEKGNSEQPAVDDAYPSISYDPTEYYV